jgi:hypothetical protein
LGQHLTRLAGQFAEPGTERMLAQTTAKLSRGRFEKVFARAAQKMKMADEVFGAGKHGCHRFADTGA